MAISREHIIQVTSTLMEKQGYHATGISEIVQESGATKGLIYHHFPAGKEQIASEVILRAGRALADRFHAGFETELSPADAALRSIRLEADQIECGGCLAGSLLASVAMEMAARSERINDACREAFGMLIHSFKAKLLTSPMDEGAAEEMAEFIVAAVEGGLILGRTYHSAQPLRRVAEEVYHALRSSYPV